MKKLMKNARIKDAEKQLSHMLSIDEAEKIVPHGEVSKKLYNDIFHTRDFDCYGCIMPPTAHPPRMHLELAVLASKMGVQFTQKANQEYKEVDSNSESDEEEDVRKRKLLTEKWKIGYVESFNPPVGLAQNPARPFNSLGNEYFYSYDGEWRAGCMQGEGKYLFRDGFTYEGRFERGKQEGNGVAYYPHGQKYEGEWKEGRYFSHGETFMLGGSKYKGEFDFGRRSGKGVLTYPSGLNYVGEFFDGKPHGRGTMSSALTGWAYEGSWEYGFIHGSGSLITPAPEKKRIVYYWAESRNKVTLPSLVRHYNTERDAEILTKEREKHMMFGELRGVQLKNYIAGIRNKMYEERSFEKKQAYVEQVTKAKEQKAKLYEARLKALAGEED
eukprot:CAMPEP_0173174866 /NCGR_PEP_ID=MMETSP1141-20130122/3584_1 /TAXON_ID=483371 /ORGANISM="non described non described, Strain CCMP2298" /LENGTH=384 /DNA_ID=CAMNT_0014097025 /DNA_START=111 /DNA_END=1265 /DNA_ORIENTATION=-